MKKFSELYQQTEEYLEEKPQWRSPFESKKDLGKMVKGLAKQVNRISPPDPAAHAYNAVIGGDPKLYDKDEKWLMKELDKVQNHIDEAIYILVGVNGAEIGTKRRK